MGGAGNLPPAPGAEPRRPRSASSTPVTANKTLGSTPRGVAPSRTSFSGTRRCRASTSATRTASTARALDRGRRREVTWSELEARDRGLRAGQVRGQVPRGRGQLGGTAHPRVEAARPVDGLGHDYYTFSDTNIEYIWRFLQIVNEKGWLYMGHRSTEWCPRCGNVPLHTS